MNIIDFLLALIFFCAIGCYAFKLHKKRVKMRAETAKTSMPDVAQNPVGDSEIARVLAQISQINPNIMGTMADNPSMTAAGTIGTAATGVKFCKFVPVKLTGIPVGLPFGETYDSSDFNESLIAAGYDVNGEIKSLSDTGLTVFAVTPLLLCYDMIVLCITAGK